MDDNIIRFPLKPTSDWPIGETIDKLMAKGGHDPEARHAVIERMRAFYEKLLLKPIVTPSLQLKMNITPDESVLLKKGVQEMLEKVYAQIHDMTNALMLERVSLEIYIHELENPGK